MIIVPPKISEAPAIMRSVTVSMPKITPETAAKTLSKQSSTAACVDVVYCCAQAWMKNA